MFQVPIRPPTASRMKIAPTAEVTPPTAASATAATVYPFLKAINAANAALRNSATCSGPSVAATPNIEMVSASRPIRTKTGSRASSSVGARGVVVRGVDMGPPPREGARPGFPLRHPRGMRSAAASRARLTTSSTTEVRRVRGRGCRDGLPAAELHLDAPDLLRARAVGLRRTDRLGRADLPHRLVARGRRGAGQGDDQGEADDRPVDDLGHLPGAEMSLEAHAHGPSLPAGSSPRFILPVGVFGVPSVPTVGSDERRAPW